MLKNRVVKLEQAAAEFVGNLSQPIAQGFNSFYELHNEEVKKEGQKGVLNFNDFYEN